MDIVYVGCFAKDQNGREILTDDTSAFTNDQTVQGCGRFCIEKGRENYAALLVNYILKI